MSQYLSTLDTYPYGAAHKDLRRLRGAVFTPVIGDIQQGNGVSVHWSRDYPHEGMLVLQTRSPSSSGSSRWGNIKGLSIEGGILVASLEGKKQGGELHSWQLKLAKVPAGEEAALQNYINTVFMPAKGMKRPRVVIGDTLQLEDVTL